MKLPQNNKGNLRPADPEKLKLMRTLMIESASTPDSGTLHWSAENGYQFHIPSDGSKMDMPMPMPVYLLGVCFMRLCTDPDFAEELTNWASRNQN